MAGEDGAMASSRGARRRRAVARGVSAAQAAGAPRPGGERPRLDAGAVAELEALYAALPALACKGLCASSCARHVDASHVERERIAAVGVDLDAPTADGACPALSRAIVASGRCTVHEVRPMVCRLWGAAASMPCPHGCSPEGGVLDDATAMTMLAASLQAGGHRDAGLVELLEVCMADPGAAALLSARMRGDRAVEPALARRLLALRAARSLTSGR